MFFASSIVNPCFINVPTFNLFVSRNVFFIAFTKRGALSRYNFEMRFTILRTARPLGLVFGIDVDLERECDLVLDFARERLLFLERETDFGRECDLVLDFVDFVRERLLFLERERDFRRELRRLVVYFLQYPVMGSLRLLGSVQGLFLLTRFRALRELVRFMF